MKKSGRLEQGFVPIKSIVVDEGVQNRPNINKKNTPKMTEMPVSPKPSIKEIPKQQNKQNPQKTIGSKKILYFLQKKLKALSTKVFERIMRNSVSKFNSKKLSILLLNFTIRNNIRNKLHKTLNLINLRSKKSKLITKNVIRLPILYKSLSENKLNETFKKLMRNSISKLKNIKVNDEISSRSSIAQSLKNQPKITKVLKKSSINQLKQKSVEQISFFTKDEQQNRMMALSLQARDALIKMQRFDRYIYAQESQKILKPPIQLELRRLQKIKNINKSMRNKYFDNQLTVTCLFNHIKTIYQLNRQLSNIPKLVAEKEELEKRIKEINIENKKNLKEIASNRNKNTQNPLIKIYENEIKDHKSFLEFIAFTLKQSNIQKIVKLLESELKKGQEDKKQILETLLQQFSTGKIGKTNEEVIKDDILKINLKKIILEYNNLENLDKTILSLEKFYEQFSKKKQTSNEQLQDKYQILIAITYHINSLYNELRLSKKEQAQAKKSLEMKLKQIEVLNKLKQNTRKRPSTTTSIQQIQSEDLQNQINFLVKELQNEKNKFSELQAKITEYEKERINYKILEQNNFVHQWQKNLQKVTENIDKPENWGIEINKQKRLLNIKKNKDKNSSIILMLITILESLNKKHKEVQKINQEFKKNERQYRNNEQKYQKEREKNKLLEQNLKSLADQIEQLSFKTKNVQDYQNNYQLMLNKQKQKVRMLEDQIVKTNKIFEEIRQKNSKNKKVHTDLELVSLNLQEEKQKSQQLNLQLNSTIKILEKIEIERDKFASQIDQLNRISEQIDKIITDSHQSDSLLEFNPETLFKKKYLSIKPIKAIQTLVQIINERSSQKSREKSIIQSNKSLIQIDSQDPFRTQNIEKLKLIYIEFSKKLTEISESAYQKLFSENLKFETLLITNIEKMNQKYNHLNQLLTENKSKIKYLEDSLREHNVKNKQNKNKKTYHKTKEEKIQEQYDESSLYQLSPDEGDQIQINQKPRKSKSKIENKSKQNEDDKNQEKDRIIQELTQKINQLNKIKKKEQIEIVQQLQQKSKIKEKKNNEIQKQEKCNEQKKQQKQNDRKNEEEKEMSKQKYQKSMNEIEELKKYMIQEESKYIHNLKQLKANYSYDLTNKQHENEQLKVKNQQDIKEIEQLQKQIQQLESQFAHNLRIKEQEIQEVRTKVVEQLQTIYTYDLTNKQHENEQLKVKNQQDIKEIEQLRKQIQQLESQFAHLNEQFKVKNQQSIKQIEQLQKQIQQLESHFAYNLRIKEQEIQDIKSQSNQSLHNYKTFSTSLQTQHNIIQKSLLQQIQLLKLQLQTYKKQIQFKQHTVQKIQKKIFVNAFQKQITQDLVNKIIVQLQNEVAFYKSELETLRKFSNIPRSPKNQKLARDQIMKLTSKILAYESDINILNSQKIQLEEIINTQNEKIKVIQSMSMINLQAKLQIQGLQQKLQIKNNEYNQLCENFQNKLKSYQNEINILTQKLIHQQQKTIQKYQDQILQDKTWSQQIDKLKKVIQDQNSRIENLMKREEQICQREEYYIKVIREFEQNDFELKNKLNQSEFQRQSLQKNIDKIIKQKELEFEKKVVVQTDQQQLKTQIMVFSNENENLKRLINTIQIDAQNMLIEIQRLNKIILQNASNIIINNNNNLSNLINFENASRQELIQKIISLSSVLDSNAFIYQQKQRQLANLLTFNQNVYSQELHKLVTQKQNILKELNSRKTNDNQVNQLKSMLRQIENKYKAEQQKNKFLIKYKQQALNYEEKIKDRENWIKHEMQTKIQSQKIEYLHKIEFLENEVKRLNKTINQNADTIKKSKQAFEELSNKYQQLKNEYQNILIVSHSQQLLQQVIDHNEIKHSDDKYLLRVQGQNIKRQVKQLQRKNLELRNKIQNLTIANQKSNSNRQLENIYIDKIKAEMKQLMERNLLLTEKIVKLQNENHELSKNQGISQLSFDLIEKINYTLNRLVTFICNQNYVDQQKIQVQIKSLKYPSYKDSTEQYCEQLYKYFMKIVKILISDRKNLEENYYQRVYSSKNQKSQNLNEFELSSKPIHPASKNKGQHERYFLQNSKKASLIALEHLFKLYLKAKTPELLTEICEILDVGGIPKEQTHKVHYRRYIQ